VHDHLVRLITSEIIASWEVPVANWAQIVPVLVSYRRYRKPLVEQSIVVQLAQYVALDDLINHFDHDDPDEVVASLYWLLALGRVRSPDLVSVSLQAVTFDLSCCHRSSDPTARFSKVAARVGTHMMFEGRGRRTGRSCVFQPIVDGISG